MDLTLTEEQKQLLALIRDFCKKEIDHEAIWELVRKSTELKTAEELRAIQPWDLIEKMHAVGLRQLAVPEEYGGGGFTIGANLTRVLLGEEMGYSGGHLAARLLTKDWQTCAAIAVKATQEQKDWFFPKFMENSTGLCAHVISEPEGGTDIHMPYDEPGLALRVAAHKDGDEWVINGNKMFSSGGGIGQFLIVLARTDKDGPISTSASAFWVLKGTPGVSFELNKMIMPDIYGNVQTHFEDVRVPDSQRVGQVNEGFDILGQIHGTKMIAFSSIIGYARNIYEQIVDYAKQRVQGGKPIIQHSHIAAMLGEVAIMLEASRSMLYRGAMEIDQKEKAGEPFNHFWSIAVFYLAKRLSLQLAELGAEVYGGISATIDLPFASWVQHVYVFLAGGGPMGVDKWESSRWYNNHTLGEPWRESKKAWRE